MIIIFHDFFKVTAVEIEGNSIVFNAKLTIGDLLYTLAQKNPEKIITWCHEKAKKNLNVSHIEKLFPHDRLMFSYNPNRNFLPNAIGYVEDSPFINVNKKNQYPTWQTSSLVGAIKAETILLTNPKIWKEKKFDICLLSIAKKYQPLGLFCYSEPRLLKENIILETPQANSKELFKFVLGHYKKIWTYLLFLNLVIYEKKVPVLAFLNVLFKSKKKDDVVELNFKKEEPFHIDLEKETIDVIIPTIGRKKYLYDVLCDLREQSHLPKNVIIVEQNPLKDSISELDYISNEKWPFTIKHIFTHQTGACQARNKALAEVKSKWVFLNDDDNRFDKNLIKEAIYNLKNLKISCLITAYPQKKENVNSTIISQTAIFGSGNAFLIAEVIAKIKFDLALEFGYGEDTEFGLQLRNSGVDVIYTPNLKITHLKAPMVGFRTKFTHPWELENIQPKPSPTVLYFRLKYYTQEQINGYKTMLFLKFYKSQDIKNPIRYLKSMKKRWKSSQRWANKLLFNNEY